MYVFSDPAMKELTIDYNPDAPLDERYNSIRLTYTFTSGSQYAYFRAIIVPDTYFGAGQKNVKEVIAYGHVRHCAHGKKLDKNQGV